MRRFFAVGFAALVLFAAVLIGRTLLNRPHQWPDAQDSAIEPPIHAEEAAGRLARALTFPTISHQDPADFAGQPFADFAEYLQNTFPAVHQRLSVEEVGSFSRLYRWKGSNPSLPPILLLAHSDVVPIEPGTEAAWTHPPFSGAISDGYVWGRGAMDFKVALLGILEAAEPCIASWPSILTLPNPWKRTWSLTFK